MASNVDSLVYCDRQCRRVGPISESCWACLSPSSGASLWSNAARPVTSCSKTVRLIHLPKKKWPVHQSMDRRQRASRSLCRERRGRILEDRLEKRDTYRQRMRPETVAGYNPARPSGGALSRGPRGGAGRRRGAPWRRGRPPAGRRRGAGAKLIGAMGGEKALAGSSDA